MCLLALLTFLRPSLGQQQLSKPLTLSELKHSIEKLEPLHEKLGKPEPGQWLDTHREKGQTFRQYLRARPNILTEARNKLYIQPIGTFSDEQQEIIDATAEYLAIYFNCESMMLPSKDQAIFPESARRIHPTWQVPQLLTSTILDDVLTPELPPDAFALIAFTATDLWPGEGWNFVFGYASFHQRVGVWSLNRLGDPAEDKAAFTQCLRRTIKIATHETGHMFSIQHCTAYRCNMQGSNSLAESDWQPLSLCPECHAKILYATGSNPAKRFEALIEFCQQHDLETELDYFRLAKDALLQ